MTKEEFEEGYTARSNMSVEQLHFYGMYGAPCECGEEGCDGWRMISDSDLLGESCREQLQLKPGMEALINLITGKKS